MAGTNHHESGVPLLMVRRWGPPHNVGVMFVTGASEGGEHFCNVEVLKEWLGDAL